jgi:hypothetical protein
MSKTWQERLDLAKRRMLAHDRKNLQQRKSSWGIGYWWATRKKDNVKKNQRPWGRSVVHNKDIQND